MRVAYLSPLPPARTGIAHYSALLLPGLRARFELDAFDSPDGYRRDAYDAAIYQLGNNPHHEWIYREAMAHPGIAVLHDVVLHHLIVEMTLARGDADGYVAALEESHGPAGAAWARGRAAGFHSEIGNFLLPSSAALANRSRAVIVHNRWAAERLRSFGVMTPIVVAPHPWAPHPPVGHLLPAGAGRRKTKHTPVDRDATRARLGYKRDDRVVGFFGFLTSAKRAQVVLEAFNAARAADPHLQLLVAGEPAPDIDVTTFDREGIRVTGYVPDEELAAFYAAADLLVNLRYPSAGETSGTLIRAFDAGRPVAVSDYAQFAEYPDACAVKVPLGEGESAALKEFFLAPHDQAATAHAQRAWLETHATVEKTVEAYAQALAAPPRVDSAAVASTLPLFPILSLESVRRSAAAVAMTLRNDGDAPILTRTYGEPAYRLLAKVFEANREIANRWLELPCDLAPGERITVEMLDTPRTGTHELRLYHAMQSIPLVESEPWTTREIPS